MQNKKMYSEQEVRKIISMALNRESSTNPDNESPGITHEELLCIGREAGINEVNLKNAAEIVGNSGSTDLDNTVLDISEITTERWISGRMLDKQIENFFAELKLRLKLQSDWWSRSVELKRLGDSYELSFQDSRVMLHEKNDGYLVQVHKSHFYNGSVLESAILGIPLAFILGVIPAAVVNDFFGVFWAVLIVVASYAISSSYVRRYIIKKREEVRDQLIVIANESEKILKEFIPGKNITDVNENQQVDLPEQNSDLKRENDKQSTTADHYEAEEVSNQSTSR